MPVNAIHADSVSFSYNGNLVLENVSFKVERGEYVGIVGPNGGGKTTLLSLILGILQPKKGKMRLFGLTPTEASKQGKIGYVPQRVTQSDFVFPATVEEVVRSGRTPVVGLGKFLTTEDSKAIETAMKTAGIWKYRARLVGTLSGGERQKVFIARALASNPELLILDEPTTGIDEPSQEEFYAFLKKLNKDNGLTIIFVSHDIDTLVHEAGSVLCLNRRLADHSSPSDFMHRHSHSHAHHRHA